MKLRQNRTGRTILAIATLLVATSTAWSQENEQEGQPAPIMLEPSGLPVEETPEAVLPAGALMHVRINGVGLLLNDVSAMAVPFVPERALPPPLSEVLKQPNAMLAAIGMMTGGEPLSVEQLSAMSGIDPKRPFSLSIYPGLPDQTFVLSIPVRDLAVFSGLISNLLPLREVEKIEQDEASIYHLQVSNANVFVVCSEKSVFACGSLALAKQLLTTPREERLDRSPLVARALKQAENANALLVLDAGPIKPMLPMLNQFAQIPEDKIAAMRSELVDELDGEGLAVINSQLRKQWGIHDVDLLLDHVECLATASYEVLFEFLMKESANFEGLVMSIDISSDFQRFEFSAYSKSIAAAESRQPLPLSKLGKIVGKLPGTHNALAFWGQAQPASKPELLGQLLDRIGDKMRKKELSLSFLETLRSAYDGYQPEQSLESQVPWTLSTWAMRSDIKMPQEYDNLQELITAVQGGQAYATPLVQLKAIPTQEKGFLAKHYSEQMKARNVNDVVFRRFLSDLGFGQPFYLKDSRSQAEELEGGVTRLIQENSYTIPWGIFGYHEHELINRSFILARDTGDFTLLYPGGRDPKFLTDYQPQKVPAAIHRLLAKANVPQDANHVRLTRVLQGVNEAVDFLAGLEDLMHRDLAGYLAQVKAIRAQAPQDEDITAKLKALEVPAEVFQLKMAPDKSYYVMTPVQLTYPRPKVMPEVVAVLKDYRDASDSLGGTVVYQRTTDGQYKLVMVQSTEALAALVRTAGNSIFDRYLSGPEGSTRLQELGLNPLDQQHRDHPTVLTNPTWKMFEASQSLPAHEVPEQE